LAASESMKLSFFMYLNRKGLHFVKKGTIMEVYMGGLIDEESK